MVDTRYAVTGSTRLLGILGQGITHTLSPTIHNVSAQYVNQNCIYVPFDLPAQQIMPFLRLFWELGGVGLNVTMPHKEVVASLIPGHYLTSVNTLYRGPDGWLATSTDGPGLAKALERLGTPMGGFQKFVFIGNGGATSAILSYMAREFEAASDVVILRRNAAKDAVLARILPPTFQCRCEDFRREVLLQELQGRGGETLVIQATNAPLHGADLRELVPALQNFRGVFVDLVYGKTSALYQKAKELGLACQDGIPMLIEQARLSQRLWWGQAAPYQVIADALTNS